MGHGSVDEFLADDAARPVKGPVCIVMAEDRVEVDSTLAHHLAAGFRDVILLAADGIDPGPDLASRVRVVRHDVYAEGALCSAEVRRWVLRPEAKMSHVSLGLQAFGAAGVVFALAFLASAWQLRK